MTALRSALIRGLVLGGLSTVGSGCSEYLERRDTLLLGAGDAVQTNIATHVIDPWPAASRRVREPADGDRIQRAVERYRTSAGTAASGPGSAPPSAPSAPPAGGTAGAGGLLR